MLKIAPLTLHVAVGLHLHIGLAPLEAIADIAWYKVGEEQRVGSLAAVFGQEAYEQQVHAFGLVPFQRPQHVPPAEREQPSAAALLHGACHRRHGDAHADKLVVLVAIHYEGDKVEVEHRHVRLHVVVDLALGELHVAIEVLVGFIDEVEDVVDNGAVLHVFLRDLLHVKVVAFLYHGRELCELLRGLRWHGEIILHVVVVLDPSAELLHVLRVIGIIVYRWHRAELVEAHDEHSLGVEVGETERTHHGGHALALAPGFHCVEESLRHLYVVNEIYPSKAHVLPGELLVGALVDDGSHASHDFAILISHEILRLAEVKGHVLVTAECVHVIKKQSRGIVGVALVKVIVEIYEFGKTLLCLNPFNLYRHLV